MKTRAWTVIVTLLAVSGAVVWSVQSWAPAVGKASAESSRPRGHPPPATTLPDDAPELDEIIERYVEAAGGRDAISPVARYLDNAELCEPAADPMTVGRIPALQRDTLAQHPQHQPRLTVPAQAQLRRPGLPEVQVEQAVHAQQARRHVLRQAGDPVDAQARRRLAGMLREALRTRRTRIPTVPGLGARRRRLEAKRRRSEVKRLRRRPDAD